MMLIALVMRNTNDNDTWTRISLAALRVLTQIEDQAAGVQQAADRDSGRGKDDGESAKDAVIILNKKRSA
jgi:hypothetical protein